MSHQCTNTDISAIQVDCKKLKFYEACLNIITHTNVTFRSRPVECEGCLLNETAKGAPPAKVIVTHTYWPLRYEIWNNTGRVCKATYHFEEYGEYEIDVGGIITGECLPRTVAEVDVAFLPILTTAVTLLLMLMAWYFMLWPKHASKYWWHLKKLNQ
ncbi:hypothetical protein EVAR_82581_1 [Eumeta japonica]|uniref:Uncharacterized protein n=1 Tax=Eumeta variegata TaxID=151549 RepID=A0A4C1UX33_EUMVA|nr:hypothetical protein EVAR_82581_1 [Eumeta japonica]